jgi:hypothetical protein
VPALQQQRPIAEHRDHFRVVADEEDGVAGCAQLPVAVLAPQLEAGVPDGEDFVEDHDDQVQPVVWRGGKDVGEHAHHAASTARPAITCCSRSGPRRCRCGGIGLLRSGSILALDAAFAMVSADLPRPEGLRSMARGAWHHIRRYGDGP